MLHAQIDQQQMPVQAGVMLDRHPSSASLAKSSISASGFSYSLGRKAAAERVKYILSRSHLGKRGGGFNQKPTEGFNPGIIIIIIIIKIKIKRTCRNFVFKRIIKVVFAPSIPQKELITSQQLQEACFLVLKLHRLS